MNNNYFNITLIGHGKILIDFSEYLTKSGFKNHTIITYKTFENGNRLFNHFKDPKIKLIETNNINEKKIINFLKTKNNHFIISVNCRMIFGKMFLNFFENVFNIHHGILPFERSGSPPTDKILNDKYKIGVTLHKVNSGIDAGSIISVLSKNVNKKLYLSEINSIHDSLSNKLFKKFIINLLNNNLIKTMEQEENLAITFPRFNSHINGAIDWNWDVDDIDKFIRGCSHPYPGAFTFYKEKKLIIFSSDLIKSQNKFHPYYIGKVVGTYDNKFSRVIAKNGIIILKEVKFGKKIGNSSNFLKVGDTLFTPTNILEKAKLHRVLSKDIKF